MGRRHGRPLGGAPHRPLRRDAVPVAHRGPDRRLRSGRPSRRRGARGASTASARCRSPRRAWRSRTPGLAAGGRRRHAPASGSARRSAAWRSARSSTPASWRAACAAWRRPWRSPSSAAPARATWRSTSGLTGPTVGNANSCASGAVAIGQAFGAIRDGTVDAALAGGAEAPLAPLTFGAFALIRVLSQRNDDPAPRLAPVRSRPRRLRDGRGCRDARARGARRGTASAARGSSPRSSGSARATTRTT